MSSSVTRDWRRPIVGMIHMPQLPGAPNAEHDSVADIAAFAVEDARRLSQAGLDAVLLQNANDHPPRKRIEATTLAAYAVIAGAVRKATDLPLGISVLKSDPTASFAIALAADAQFVRLKSYVGVEIGAEGLVEGCAAEAVQIRRDLGLQSRVEIWADALQPTSRPLGDPSVVQLVEWCHVFGQADRVIVTGRSLDESLALLEDLRGNRSVPLILGGGVDMAHARRGYESADGLIVGRHLRAEGLRGPVDSTRARAFVTAARQGTTE